MAIGAGQAMGLTARRAGLDDLARQPYPPTEAVMSVDDVATIRELRDRVAAFAAERDWDRFHSPKNLVMALTVEAAELMELFQWKTEEESWSVREDPAELQRVREEIADVAIFVLNLANRPSPTRHYRRTIERRVPLADIAPHVSESFLAELRAAYPDGSALVWGATPGNRDAWDKMAVGDHVLFYKEGQIVSSAVLRAKTRSKSLAAALWDASAKGDLFEYTFFLEDLRRQQIPYADVWELCRFGRRDLLPRLTVLPPDASSTVLNHYREELAFSTQWIEEAVRDAAEDEYGRQQGFATTPEERKAIELYAVERAEREYTKQGFRVTRRGKPYDLLCEDPHTGERFYVEVKGTKTPGEEILLTPNEVRFARAHGENMKLFLVHSVAVTGRDGRIVVSRGQMRELDPWSIYEGELQPTGFSYRLPAT